MFSRDLSFVFVTLQIGLYLCVCAYDASHDISENPDRSSFSFTGEVQENPAGPFGEGTPCSADFGGTCMYNLKAYTLYSENNINIIQLYCKDLFVTPGMTQFHSEIEQIFLFKCPY